MVTSDGSPTLEQFRVYVEAHPGRLQSWGQDQAAMYPLLAWLNVWPVVEQRRMTMSGDPTGALLALRQHYNQLGVAVSWAFRYLGHATRSAHPLTERHRRALFDLAGIHVAVDNLLADAQAGVRHYEAHARTVTLKYSTNAHVDSLDRLLALVDDMRALPNPEEAGQRWSATFRKWLERGGWNMRWSGAPAEAQAEYRREAHRILSAYPHYLRSDLDVGQFNISDAEAVLAELLGRAMHSHVAATRGSTDLWVVIPPFLRAELISDFSKSIGRSSRAVAPIIDLLTYVPERSRDPCLSPLIPVGQALVPMSSLIVPSNLTRNFTAVLQRDPRLFGPAGRQLGALGVSKLLDTLQRLAGAEVATRVKVLRPNRSAAGDLDVVAYDREQQLMAIFEVMWQIAPDGSRETARVEALAAKKREQAAALRDEVARGEAIPRWPPNWSNAPDASLRWFVITPRVLPLRARAKGITIRSHQMLAYTLRRNATVADLIRLMDRPPYPPRELAKTTWRHLRYGQYTVEFDVLPP
jgi:hypothetical protein